MTVPSGPIHCRTVSTSISQKMASFGSVTPLQANQAQSTHKHHDIVRWQSTYALAIVLSRVR